MIRPRVDVRFALLLVALASVGFACSRILGFPDWSGPRVFEHRAHVLEGIPCNKCHPKMSRVGDSGPVKVPTTASCLECHEKPHDSRECSGCHGLATVRRAAIQARQYLRFSHERHMEPSRNNCVRCHSEVQTERTSIRPTMASCFTCHEHKDQWDIRDCDGCHVDLPSELTRPVSHLVHDGEFVREHGVRAATSDLCQTCHTQRFCAACHGQTAPAIADKLRFDDVLRPGIHRAGFLSRHSEEARAQPGLCASCHREDMCQGCHSDKGVSAAQVDGRSPHPPGWLGAPGQANDHGRAAWRNPAECAACHGGAGEALCIGCHRVGGVGGNPHPVGWSSRLSERDLPCVLCHGGAL